MPASGHDAPITDADVLIADPNPLRIAVTGIVLLAVVLAILVRHFATRVQRGCPDCPHCAMARQRQVEADYRHRVDEARRNLRWLGVSDDEIERHLRDIEKRR